MRLRHNKIKRHAQLFSNTQLKSIPCGIEYLNKTIGLSLTDNDLYQFLLINKTIQFIRYEYRNLSNDYKLNLIDGQMMNNELDILITSNVVKQLMTVINWIDDKHHLADDNSERPILSMAISINEFGSIRIYCLKSFDQYKYIIGDYNQEIDFDQLKTFFAINDQQKIRGTISNENQGILSSFYGKNLSFSLDILKLNENYYGNTNFEWTKSLAVDSSKTFIYEINDYPSKTERKTLTKSFQQIFGPHQFTYGFVTDNKIYLFSNQDEKIISFASEFNKNRNDSNQKYPFKLQSFKDFFHCNKPLDPVIIDKNKQTTISTTTVKQQSPTTTIISTMKTAAAVTKSPNIITTNKSNDSITTTTTTTDEASIDEEHSTSFPIIIIILVSIMLSIFIIFIGLIVYYIRKKSYKKKKTEFVYKFPLHRYQLEILPKKQYNLDDDNLSSMSSILPTSSTTSTTTSTMMSEKLFQDSSISKIPASSTAMMSDKFLQDSSISKIPASSTTTAIMSEKLSSTSTLSPTQTKVNNISEILYE